jgi:hypothetical protein
MESDNFLIVKQVKVDKLPDVVPSLDFKENLAVVTNDGSIKFKEYLQKIENLKMDKEISVKSTR